MLSVSAFLTPVVFLFLTVFWFKHFLSKQQEVLGELEIGDAEAQAAEEENDEADDAEMRVAAVTSVLKVDVAQACEIVNQCLDNLEKYDEQVSELLSTEEVQGAMSKDEWQLSEQHLQSLREKTKASNSLWLVVYFVSFCSCANFVVSILI